MKFKSVLGIITIIITLIITINVNAEEYKIGTKINYKNISFYVIDDKDDYLTLLKSTPLTVDEVNKYGQGYVNKNTEFSTGEAYNVKEYGYGSVAYYSSETCGYVNGSWVYIGCTNLYDESDIKHIVDEWSKNKLNDSDLQEVQIKNSKYKSRLMTIEELKNNLGYEVQVGYPNTIASPHISSYNTPFWVYNYSYCTMSEYDYDNYSVFRVENRLLEPFRIFYSYESLGSNNNENKWIEYDSSANTVRPVIHLKKSSTFNKVNKVDKKSIKDAEFKVGDIVEYNGIDYYVIKDSSNNDNKLTMVKKFPLSYEEIKSFDLINNTLVQGTDYSETGNFFHPGYVKYLSNDKCEQSSNNCSTDYDTSSIKSIVDEWATKNLDESDLTEDNLGYKVRLLTIEEINQDLRYVGRGPASTSQITGTEYYQMSEDTVVNLQNCWTMSSVGDSYGYIYAIDSNGNVNATGVNSTYGICPVITVNKSLNVEGKEDNMIISIPDTLLKNPIFVVMIGLILIISTAFIIIYLLIKKFKHK